MSIDLYPLRIDDNEAILNQLVLVSVESAFAYVHQFDKFIVRKPYRVGCASSVFCKLYKEADQSWFEVAEIV